MTIVLCPECGAEEVEDDGEGEVVEELCPDCGTVAGQ
jgi:predicted RNA-binding Zn-ribbon protein involved in translation (DUF1610 family)